MHIPQGMIEGAICPVTAAVSTAGIAASAYYAYTQKEKPSASRFAAVSAFIFAAQMINFPVASGTSGHLIGGVLAVSLLGLPFGVLAMALVVILQSLLFADGGISVLGANLFNMALIAPCIGALIYKKFSSRLISLALASWLSVMAAALMCSLQLGLAGTVSLTAVLPAMLGIHALIGAGEAGVTLAAGSLLARKKSRPAFIFASALLVAGGISPFASSLPDGLEWVALRFDFLKEAAPLFARPFSDYSLSFISHPGITTAAAGLIGVGLTFLCGAGIGKQLAGIKKK